MKKSVEARAEVAAPAAVGERATVREELPDGAVTVALEASGEAVLAQVALPWAGTLRAGDLVVALPVRGASGAAEWCVVAVLRALRVVEPTRVIRVEEGDLALEAPGGRVTIVARDGVVVRAGASAVAVTDAGIDAKAPRAEVGVGEARVVARSVSTVAQSVRTVAEVVELEATRVVERLKNAYRDVEELAQTRAGRVRVVARAAMHLMSGRTVIKAEQDVKVKGAKIHLG